MKGAMKSNNDIHIIKEEYIGGKSASNVIPVMSSIIYQINAGDECVKLSFEELNFLGEIIGLVVNRDKPYFDNIKAHSEY